MSQTSKKALAAQRISERAHFFRCPICSSSMSFENNSTLICDQRHSYDLAKKGYIHLLSQMVHTKYDKALFQSRQRVAESGFFAPIVEEIGEFIKDKSKAAIFDAGCGEGALLSQLQNQLASHEIIGFGADISKEGVQLAAGNSTNTIWLVADLANCPLQSRKFDFILNILSPSNYSEFDRLLTEDGMLIKVVPNSGYLQELRAVFYGDRFDNEKTITRFQEKFELMETRTVRYNIFLKQPLLDDLVKMTPLSWSANENKLEYISKLPSMNITVDVNILVGKQKNS